MPPPDAELVLAQLNGQLAVLEGARTELEAGWVQGGWWAAGSGDGNQRLATGYAAAGGQPGSRRRRLAWSERWCGPGRRLPDARSDVGRAVDAVYDALWASRGQPDALRPGGCRRSLAPDVRLARVRTLTQWNDQAGRAQDEVLAVVDRAISATIMDLMSAPRPPQPVGAAPGVRAG